MEIAMFGRPFACSLLAVGFLAGGAWAQQQVQPIAPPKAEAAFAAKREPFGFELFRGNRIFFSATVNGRPAQVLLDSGAASSVLSTRYADAIGVAGGQPITARGASGTAQAWMVPGVTIAVGPLTLKSTVIKLDLTEIERGIGRPIDLILGREAFDAGIVDIDFEKREIAFLPREGYAAPAGAAKVAMTRGHGIRKIPVAIGDRAPILADFDLGHGGSLMLARADWKDDAELAALPSAATRSGGVGGMSDKRYATLPSVTVGGSRFERVPALLNLRETDLPERGANIGIDMLQRFHLAIDFTGDTLWLTPSRSLGQPLPKDRLGMRLEKAERALNVVYVSPDGPAAKAGWKAGDTITAVDGKPVGPDFYRTLYASMSRLPAGTRVELMRGDGVRQPVVLADYF
jgi:hypothetical protein